MDSPSLDRILLVLAESPLQPALLLLGLRARGRREVAPGRRGGCETGLAAATERDWLPCAAWWLHWTAAVALLLLRRVLAVFGNRTGVSVVAVLSAVHAVLLGLGGRVDAVERAVLAARVGAVLPWPGRVGSYGVVGLVVAVLRIDTVATAIAIVVVSIGVAATTGVVAHSLLWSVGVGFGTTGAVAVVATRHVSAALRVAVGFVAQSVSSALGLLALFVGFYWISLGLFDSI